MTSAATEPIGETQATPPAAPATPPAPQATPPAPPATPAASVGSRSPTLGTVTRLRERPPADGLVSWAVTLAIGALAFVIRFVNLGHPKDLVFDETYYAKDAWSLLRRGYEAEWPDGANEQILAGTVDLMRDAPAFVVHPPVGKWLIAVGEAMFGMNSFGWRFMACVFGTLLVVLTVRLARRLSRSTLVGALAGILLTFDGLAFTMSRIALLDIFQAFFLVAAVAALVADRDHYRWKLADLLDARGVPDFGGAFGPLVLWRPWRWVAGLMFGLALGTKWSSVYVLAAFGLLAVLWDVGARRLAGADFRAWLALLADGIPAFVAIVVTAAVGYVATWWSWFANSGGYARSWGVDHADDPLVGALGPDLAAWVDFHRQVYAFHTGDYIEGVTHPYDAHPATWLLMLRPIGLYYVGDIQPGTEGCVGADACVRAAVAMGTPVLWWLAAAALVVSVIWWLGARDWRFGVPVVGVAATWLPWFTHTERPLFFFYAVTIVPFTVISLAMVLGLLLGDADSPGRRRAAVLAGVATAAVVANFAYHYPVLTSELLPYPQWLARMWLQTWI